MTTNVKTVKRVLVSLNLPMKTASLVETATALVSSMTSNPIFATRSAARKPHGRRRALEREQFAPSPEWPLRPRPSEAAARGHLVSCWRRA